jgi:hypothetical protein
MTDRPCPICDHEDDETLCDCEQAVEAAYWHRLYCGERSAGIVGNGDTNDAIREAGRGHLLREDE